MSNFSESYSYNYAARMLTTGLKLVEVFVINSRGSSSI
jgi:hypothetical protein